jgi:hypothetical protein
MKKTNANSSRNKSIYNFIGTIVGVGILAVLTFGLYNLLATQRHGMGIQSDTDTSLSEETVASLTSTPAVTPDQSDSTADWKTYTSPLGYSIKYPAAWFATSHPAINRGDILYEKEDFLKVVSGEVLISNPEWESYFHVVIQQFTLDELDLSPADSVEKAVQRINGDDTKLHQKEPFYIDGLNSSGGLLQTIEVQKQYSVTAYIIHENNVYMISSLLPNLEDSYRLEIFKKIASSIQFPQ